MNDSADSISFWWWKHLSFKAITTYVVILYVLLWCGAVYRLIHPTIKAKMHFAAEFITWDGKGVEVEKKLDPKQAVEEVKRKLNDFRTRYPSFTFKDDLTAKQKDNTDRYLTAAQTEEAFVQAACRLAVATEPSYEFSKQLMALDEYGGRWSSEDVNPKFAFWQRPFRNYHVYHGASFRPPFAGSGGLREDARLYLTYRDAFGAAPEPNTRTGQSPSTLPITAAAGIARWWPPLNRETRFLPQQILREPWRLFRFNDPGRYELSRATAVVMLALCLGVMFVLELRFSQRRKPRSQLRLWQHDPPYKRKGEKRWIAFGFIVIVCIMCFAESHETWPEWPVTVLVLCVTAVLVPVMLTSMASMTRAELSDEFRALSVSRRHARLRPFLLGATSLAVICLWTAHYSVFGLMLSYDRSRVLRGLGQLALIMLILCWLLRLGQHLYLAPVAPKSKRKEAKEDDDAKDVGGAFQQELIRAIAVAMIPASAGLLSALF
jgi:hypothetical protein